MNPKIYIRILLILFSINSLSGNAYSSTFRCNQIFYDDFISKNIQKLPKIETTTVLPLNGALSENEITQLGKRFKLAYIFEKVMNDKMSENPSDSKRIVPISNFGITTMPITEENVDQAINLFVRVFEEKNPNRLSKDEVLLIESKLKGFLLGSSETSTLYYIDNKPVALIGIWPGLIHPLLKTKVNHIGVVGYDSVLLNQEQAKAVKLDWQEIIYNAHRLSADPITKTTARVDLFNFPSQSLFFNYGFKPVLLELTPK